MNTFWFSYRGLPACALHADRSPHTFTPMPGVPQLVHLTRKNIGAEICSGFRAPHFPSAAQVTGTLSGYDLTRMHEVGILVHILLEVKP